MSPLKKKITVSLTVDLVSRLTLEPRQSCLIEQVMREYYAGLGVEIGYTEAEERRGGARRGSGRPRTPVAFRHPQPTRGDVSAMLIFQSHHRPEHQLARGKQDAEARQKIRNSLAKYGQWLKVAVIKSQIVGTIGVYPVAQLAVDGVLAGTLNDSALVPDAEGSACYISGINILPTHRCRRQVIHGLMLQIAEAIADLSPTMVYAQPATAEGKRMAIRLGFTQCEGQDDAQDPLYQCYMRDSIEVWQRVAIAR